MGRSQEADVRFDAELLINPAAIYAIGINQSSNGNTRVIDTDPQVIVVLIDLRTFQVV